MSGWDNVLVGHLYGQWQQLYESSPADTSVQAWDFSQAVIPALLAAHGGTLIITGATMARRAGANFAAMASASFARRALAQSLAKEFGPLGVHVAHVIVDGLIDTAHVDQMMGKAEAGTRLDPNDIAEVRHRAKSHFTLSFS